MSITLFIVTLCILSLNVIIQAKFGLNNNNKIDSTSYEDSDTYVNLSTGLDYDETMTNEETEETEEQYQDKDIDEKEGKTAKKILAAGNDTEQANKVKVTPRDPSKHYEWVDHWSGCKCGKGFPGGLTQNPKKRRLLKIVSGYVPHR